jgi:flagellar L-ring protein precursor FlgH
VAVGSLWPADDHVFFYADKKALRVGDIITVRIVESAQASNTADTDLSRSSSANASLSTFFGKKKFLNLFKLGDDLLTSSAENNHQGSGSTTRSGQLTATMTAVVREVLPNGNLVVQGTREVLVNHEQQFITLTGIVRPLDVDRDNVVLSTQLADANITIGGLGVVADKQRSGWGTWFFDFVWPF